MQTVRSALIGIAFSLLAVGLVGGTLLRQMIQVVPILLALRLMSRSPGYLGAYAAISISAFWMFIIVSVWLSVLGASDPVPGDYAPIQIVLSVLMALFAWVGFSRGRRVGRPLERHQKMATLAVFAILQIAAVAVSFIWLDATDSGS